MIRKDIKSIIKQYFFVNPSSRLRVRELERTLKLPLPSVIRYCRELHQENILKIFQIGNSKFYTASKSEHFLLEKRLFNIKSLYDSGLIDFLKKEYNNPGIILFGSYSRGEDIETSDVDIYIQTSSKKIVKTEKFDEKLKRNIQIFVFNDINNIKNKHLANNIINGITLNNYVGVFK